ncbi:MAG: (2Fe-2S)-binding protein [Deltaproteobacteria bacterium]|nr:(2Fe-2S)-binding protein [Deltaproteobacteria bacterium]
MSRKIIVCRCEDVTLEDIRGAIERGYRDIEEVKRYTGLGTGPCQGRECMCHCAVLIAQRTGQPVGSVPPFTTRPPLTSSALKHFVLPTGARDAAPAAPARRGGADAK